MPRWDQIKARLAAITPDAWECVGNTVMIDPPGPGRRWWALPGDSETAAFIAHAPADIAWLIGVVEESEARLKVYMKADDTPRGFCPKHDTDAPGALCDGPPCLGHESF